MKRSFIFCLAVLLAASSAALAEEFDQDRNDRPRSVTLRSSGFLGVDLAEVTSAVVGRLKLREERGALVTGVFTETAASKAGLQKDDVIVKWNGEAIDSVGQLWRHIHETPVGRAVRLTAMREGREIEVNVTMGDRGEYQNRYRIDRIDRSQVRSQLRDQIRDRVRQARQPVTRIRDRRNYRMGISLQGMSPQLAEYFGLKDRNGALVVFVHPDTAAAKAGIKAGDVILSIGGETVENAFKVHQVLRSKAEGPTEVRVMRDRQERTFTIQLEKAEPSSVFISPDDFDDFGDIIVEVPLVDIEPLQIEIPVPPMAPMPRIAVPAVRVAPIKMVPMAPMAPLAPIEITPMIIAPVAVPEIHFIPVRPPKISIPPLKLIMPKLVFINPV
ncbi:MAG: PDZ domain-containing protein [Blastocatellia bacterium]